MYIYVHIYIYEDEELREVFTNGARDFQVSERREAKNIKELLVTSTISTVVNEEENSGSGPCNKNCAYCDHLRRTEADMYIYIYIYIYMYIYISPSSLKI